MATADIQQFGFDQQIAVLGLVSWKQSSAELVFYKNLSARLAHETSWQPGRLSAAW